MTLSADDRRRPLTVGLRSDLQAAADEHGYRLGREEADGWFFVRSATAPGELGLAGAGEKGPYFLSVRHPGAARELSAVATSSCCTGHTAAFYFDDEMALREAIGAVYRLSRSLPTLPLEAFERDTATLGSTVADRLQRVRIGQDIFRRALVEYWNGTCPLTGLGDPSLLRASHMRPWAQCESDAQRLDVHNGLLLSALWDAAFDAGLVTFDDFGVVIPSSQLSRDAHLELGIERAPRIPLRPEHLLHLEYHRRCVWIA